MSYPSIPLPGFGGGLNLRDGYDVNDPSQAIDLLNVTFGGRGSVKSRDGYAKVTSTALTNQPDSLFPFYTTAGLTRLLVGNGARVDAFSSFPGATAANTSALTNTTSPHFFARFGGPTVEAVYIANGADRLKRYTTGGNFTEPAGLSGIAPKFLAVQSPDNRLVGARFVGTTAVSNPSTVRFSAAGDPETFGASDYVQLDPGDGEQIMGVASWSSLTFVFKETKFFVFYGNSISSTGTAVFNFRRVSSGVGVAASKAIAVGRDGVYFLDRKGVYRTTGQEPELVSPLVDPFFAGDPSSFFVSSTLNKSLIAQSAMAVHDGRLYLSVPTGAATTNDRILVYDPALMWWTLYDIPASAMTSFRPSTNQELVFGYAAVAAGKHVGRHVSTYAADDMTTAGGSGTAITSRWRSSWWDLGTQNVKKIRETRVWGSGSCSVGLSKDFLAPTTTTAVAFSANPTLIVPRLVRQARRGTVLSTTISHSTLNEAWQIHRADYHAHGERPVSVPRTEVAA